MAEDDLLAELELELQAELNEAPLAGLVARMLTLRRPEPRGTGIRM